MWMDQRGNAQSAGLQQSWLICSATCPSAAPTAAISPWFANTIQAHVIVVLIFIKCEGDVSTIPSLKGIKIMAYNSAEGSLYGHKGASQIVRIDGLAAFKFDEPAWRQVLHDTTGMHASCTVLPVTHV